MKLRSCFVWLLCSALLAAASLAACGPAEQADGPSGAALSSTSDAPPSAIPESNLPEGLGEANTGISGEGRTLLVWTEKLPSSTLEGLSNYMEALYPGLTVELTVLPSFEDPDCAEQLQRLRTELLGGSGPDLFVLSSYQINGNTHVLFPDVEKTMRAGIFLDLEPWFSSDPALSGELFLAPVMEAGFVGEQRFLVPLQYYYSYYYADSAEAFAEADLSEADFTDASSYLAARRRIGNPDHNAAYFGTYSLFAQSPFDYDAGAFVPSTDTFRELLESLCTRKEVYELPVKYGEGYPFDSITGAEIGPESVGYPLRNDAGGITALINGYALVYAGSQNPDLAVEFIKLLLSEPVQRGDEIVIDGQYYLPQHTGGFWCAPMLTGTCALPVRRDCCRLELLAGWEEELNAAVLMCEGEEVICAALENCIRIGETGDSEPDYDAILEELTQELDKYTAE